MRLVGVKSLKDGDKLGRAVCSSNNKVILNAGVTLNDNYIEKLKQLKIYKVYIDDGRFEDVELVESLDVKTRNAATQILSTAYNNLHKDKEIDEYVIKDVAKDIVDYVRDARDKGVSLLTTDTVDEFVIEHSINVAILTVMIGNRMDYNFNQLCDMATGALIHDLGRENQAVENPEHPQKGFDVMRKCRGLSLHSSIVCYEHHENYDGSGYPRKLKGTAISEYTRVIRVADYYENILHGEENNNVPVMPHQAFENVLAVSGKILDPEVVKVFRDTIIFYPNGSTVLLSNGLKGVVIKQNIGSPQRPIVRIFNDTSVIGEIDLFKSLTIFIKDVLIV